LETDPATEKKKGLSPQMEETIRKQACDASRRENKNKNNGIEERREMVASEKLIYLKMGATERFVKSSPGKWRRNRTFG